MEAANVAQGLELGALDRAAGSVAEAVAGAKVVFCAAPVAALPGLVAEALAASDEPTVVSDVGSTKRELIAGLGEAPGADRFIGGHPLAGAETAGVENARGELLDGARWYLTPTPAVSAPASGCPPMNRESSSPAAIPSISSRLVEPTSVTTVASRLAFRASETSPGSAPTGAAQKTTSASATASATLSAAWSTVTE